MLLMSQVAPLFLLTLCIRHAWLLPVAYTSDPENTRGDDPGVPVYCFDYSNLRWSRMNGDLEALGFFRLRTAVGRASGLRPNVG